MTDLIVKDVDDALVERITAFAAALGWGQARTLRFLLEQGLRASVGDERSSFDADEDTVLAAAISALEQVPDDTFALIGRSPAAS
ncbi:hypothetical protein CMZ82_16335 [Lysobacteraceae bacterium NML93-0792]|nr:hypothetical protein CMZ82_16335 [Xanthomonadaceae bacterium NML93-0792]PBS14360.1 hypothetical protein CMZ81_16405 [Xanthomonadaceae bacterium NML93-0793]PBS17569.1 hypothetical protein CMZ80_16475 [Xanthomonadaceae bacterium NML93-0831]